jgi:hypothetical protein
VSYLYDTRYSEGEVAKAKTMKIPKTIGGVKIPKELRKTGNALIEKANSPEGRQVIASGMAMMATAAMAARSQAGHAPSPRSAAGAGAAGETAKDGAAAKDDAAAGSKAPGMGGTQNVEQMVEAIGTAAEAAIKRMFGGKLTGG